MDKKSNSIVNIECDGISLSESKRKMLAINRGKFGSVRNVNNQIYFDFKYLSNRVREPYGKKWDVEGGVDLLLAREQLDRIGCEIEAGSFIFSETFPDSKKRQKFTGLEIKYCRRNVMPDELLVKDYLTDWLDDLRASGTMGRTLNGYRSNNTLYIEPYWGDMAFSDLKRSKLPEFYEWAREQRYRKSAVSNKSLNRYVCQLKRIAKHAAEKFDWCNYVAFSSYKKLKEKPTFEDINPFTLDEQKAVIQTIDPFWRPYVDFAFASGLSAGEQDALPTTHVNLNKRQFRVQFAATLDEQGKKIISQTKNVFRDRTIRMNARIYSAVEAQMMLRKKLELESETLFCMPSGQRVDRSWFTRNIWRPAFSRLDNVEYRPLRQSRHTYATHHRSHGQDPLSIAQVLGHCDTTQLEKVYTKFKKRVVGVQAGDEEVLLQIDFGLNQIPNSPDPETKSVGSGKCQ